MNRCEAGFGPRKLVAKSPQSVENSGIFSAPDFATGFCEALSLSHAYKTVFLRRFCGFTKQIDALKTACAEDSSRRIRKNFARTKLITGGC